MKAKRQRTRMAAPQRRVTVSPLRIEITTDEVLADLLYPAPVHGARQAAR